MPTLNREIFLRKLGMVQPGISTKAMIEQSDCFIFSNGSVFTFNDEISCQTESGLDKNIKCAVPAKPLLDLLGKLKVEEVDVSVKDSKLWINVKNESSYVNLEMEVTLPVEAVEVPKEWSPLEDDFLQGIEVAGRCAGRDETAFDTACIHIAPKWVEAYDQYQMTRYMVNTPMKSDSILVRKKSIKHIVSLGVNEIAETDSWTHFRSGELVLSCRRFLNPYMNLTPYLKVDGVPCILPKGIGEVADRAEVFSADSSDDNLISVDLLPGKVRITSVGTKGGHKGFRKASYDGPPIKFRISPKMLQDILKRHNAVTISSEKLSVDGGKWTFVACLEVPEEKPSKATVSEEE